MSSTSAEYQRRYRAAVPEYADNNRVYLRCRSRALRRLADRHPIVFARMLADELADEGYEWVGRGGKGTPKVRRNLGITR